MQGAVIRITRLKMVSNIQKPAPTANGPPASAGTNGVAASKSSVVMGDSESASTLQRKPLKIVSKRLHQNGILNGCSVQHGYKHHSPSSSPSLPTLHVPKALAAGLPSRIPTQNGKATQPPPASNLTKTRGAHSNEQGSCTSLSDQSQHRRLVCPELAISYTGTLMSNRAGQLVGNQRELELWFANVTRKLHEKQLRGVICHTQNQLHFQNQTTSSNKVANLAGSLEGSSTKVESLSSVASGSDKVVEHMDTEDGLLASRDVCEQTLPIQVDGASDEQLNLSLHTEDQPVAASNQGEGLKPTSFITTADKDNVFREEGLKSSTEQLFRENDHGMKRIEQQLDSLRRILDDDATDSSSDEEEDAPTITR